MSALHGPSVTEESRAIDADALRQAAWWMAQLASGEANQADAVACAQWRAAHPENERAWQRAEQLGGKLRGLPASLAMRTLDRPRSSSRRDALRGLLGLAVAAPAGVCLWRRFSVDYQTGKGERLATTLADGSRLLLDAATRVRVEFDADIRRLRLLDGRIRLETAVDPSAPARPLVVVTRDGRVRALGTRFAVETFDTDSGVVVESGAVEVRSAMGTGVQVQVMQAGQRTRFAASGIQVPTASGDADLGWIHGLMYADDERLDAFLAQLSRYRKGWMRCDPEVAGLHISGVFRLDDPDHVLGVISRTLPVRVVRFGMWTRVQSRQA